MQGRGQRRAVERAAAPVLDPLDPEVLLLEQQVGGPRAPRQRQGAAVRADHQVRAVVDVVAGHGVARRGGPAAENAAPLEEHDLVAALLERDRRGEAGEAAAHDEDLHQTFQYTRGIVRSAVQSFRGFPSETRSPPTGWPRRAHCSRSVR